MELVDEEVSFGKPCVQGANLEAKCQASHLQTSLEATLVVLGLSRRHTSGWIRRIWIPEGAELNRVPEATRQGSQITPRNDLYDHRRPCRSQRMALKCNLSDLFAITNHISTPTASRFTFPDLVSCCPSTFNLSPPPPKFVPPKIAPASPISTRDLAVPAPDPA